MLVLLSLLLFIVLTFLFPLAFSELMFASLSKLHLSPSMALTSPISIFLGGLVNIPVMSTTHGRDVIVHPLTVYGLSGLWPRLQKVRQRTVIAANVDGCLIPGRSGNLRTHQSRTSHSVGAVRGSGRLRSKYSCLLFNRPPVAALGIIMPGVISPLIAAGSALLLAPEMAAPYRFRQWRCRAARRRRSDTPQGYQSDAGLISIGGAGTFDGIILSGIEPVLDLDPYQGSWRAG